MAQQPSKDRTPDVIASSCLGVRFRMLNRVVSKVYDDALRPFGLRTSQLNILVATAKMGLARPAVISERLFLDVSTLSRNVERMRENGWIELLEDEHDARAHSLRLTPKGRGLLDRVRPAWEEAQERVVALVGEETGAALDAAIERVRAAESAI